MMKRGSLAGGAEPVMVVNADRDGEAIEFLIRTRRGAMTVIANMLKVDESVYLVDVHVSGEGPTGPNKIGPAELRRAASTILEIFDARELVIQGGIRTTGASKGRRPKPRVFRR
ncbi:MAG: hypothetical protein FJX52_14785 [Alphaproteobacteria bacterium]|nr:hypothetical protein [Alphaproteobacteria bacterium]